MKKSVKIILWSILVFGITACGGKSNNNTNDSNENSANTENVSNGNDSGAAKYFKMFSDGTYHMKAKMLGSGMESTVETYMKDGICAIVTEMQGISGKMILKDNKLYIINDETKMVMVSKTTPASKTIESGIKTAGMTHTGSGKAEFAGKNLPYDEYSNKEGNKAQYFLDGGKLAGIRTINDEMSIDIIILVLDQDVPDKVFDVPSSYQKIEY